MVFVAEKFYFNGKPIKKHVLDKYIKWEKILSAIKNGTDDACFLKERLGVWAKDSILYLKREGMIIASNNNRTATYTVSEKGEQLIKDVKQYQKEKKDEESRMFRGC